MSTLRKISGKDCIKILCNDFGFSVIRQKGSHVILKKQQDTGTIGTVFPNHKELKKGTLRGILKLANISEEDFSKHQ